VNYPPAPQPTLSAPGGLQSLLSAPNPALLDAQRGVAAGGSSSSSGISATPDLSASSAFDKNGAYTSLRSALSAPQAEGIAKSLLDHGESYDLVTAAIPQPFQGIVSAKLPKRISSVTNY
jgi:hypothetical protein